MPITVNCPTCNRALRVPEELLGKRVKCPACATVLTASAEGEVKPAASPPQGEEVVRRKRPPEPEEEAPRPARGGPEPAEEEDYDEEEPEEEEEERTPRRRRRRIVGSRQRARDAVVAPAIALIVLGATYICVSIVHLVLLLIGASIAPQGQQQQPADTAFERGRQFGQTIAPVIDIVGMCLGGILILGGFQMKGLKSYGYALTGIITAMLPCHCCFLLGIGFGIWALVVINRPEIKSSFG
jgi:hypothetical protein